MNETTQTTTTETSVKTTRWLDDSKNVDKIFWALIGVCAVFIVVEPFYHKHPYLGFDGMFGFFAFFGFLAPLFLVFFGRCISLLLARKDDFYDAALKQSEDDH